MNKKIMGNIGEEIVYDYLKKLKVDVYKVNKKNQKNFDIFILKDNKKIITIEVKTTILQNESTNNSVRKNQDFDFMVIVILDENNEFNFFILSNKEVLGLKKKNKKLSVSEKSKTTNLYQIKKIFEDYKDKWEKINDKK